MTTDPLHHDGYGPPPYQRGYGEPRYERGYGLLAKAGIQSLRHDEPGHLVAVVPADTERKACGRVEAALAGEGYSVVRRRR